MNNLLLIQPNTLLKKFYPAAVWNFPREEKNIYLTFDDGPVPGVTEWVLDLLKQYKATATFFCVGSNILRHPEIFERIKTDGHSVANHTMKHIKGLRSSHDEYLGEVGQCRSLVGNTLFRPPYGQLRPSQYRSLVSLGYRIVLWDVISYDFEKISRKRCAGNVIRNTRGGSIILFHDSVKAEKNLRHALPQCLDHFSAKGYSFKRIKEDQVFAL